LAGLPSRPPVRRKNDGARLDRVFIGQIEGLGGLLSSKRNGPFAQLSGLIGKSRHRHGQGAPNAALSARVSSGPVREAVRIRIICGDTRFGMISSLNEISPIAIGLRKGMAPQALLRWNRNS
jgi:hypothetical protein